MIDTLLLNTEAALIKNQARNRDLWHLSPFIWKILQSTTLMWLTTDCVYDSQGNIIFYLLQLIHSTSNPFDQAIHSTSTVILLTKRSSMTFTKSTLILLISYGLSIVSYFLFQWLSHAKKLPSRARHLLKFFFSWQLNSTNERVLLIMLKRNNI